MKPLDIEKRLSAAISNEVPDVLDSILSKCETPSSGIIEPNQLNSKAKNSTLAKSLFSAAAALVLMVGGYFGISQYQAAIAVESVITLDVNPSVMLEVNKFDKVISAKGINEDGYSILNEIEHDGEKLKDKELEAAINVLINAMVEDGYLSQTRNSILVTVNNSEEGKSAEIKSQLLVSINNSLREKSIDGAILGQSDAVSEKAAALAKQYGISDGKASFIEKIITKSPLLSSDDLVSLNINDLSLLAKEWLGEIDELTIIGTPSDNGIISSERAIESACSDKNAAIGENAEIGTSIQLQDGKLVYDVSLITGTTVYNYIVDAKTGEIVNWVSKVIASGSVSTDQSSVTGNSDDNAHDTSAANPNSTTSDSEDIINDVFDFVIGIIGEKS